MGVELCRALAAIHSRGLVHLDLKPRNVMREKGGRIVLVDFGFARASALEVDREGSSLGGTPPFMSPEHFDSEAEVGPWTDLFSLGALLYWIVTGKYPYAFTRVEELPPQILRGQQVPLLDRRPNVPGPFADVISRAMAHQRKDRFATAGEMEEALRTFLLGESPEPRTRGTDRPPLVLGGILAAGCVVVFSWMAPSGSVPSPTEAPAGDEVRSRLRSGGKRTVFELDELLNEGVELQFGQGAVLRGSSDKPGSIYFWVEKLSDVEDFEYQPSAVQDDSPEGEDR